MKKFPLLISIPHGGTKVPEELKNRICIEQEDLFNDIDHFTREIYDIGGRAMAVITTNIARILWNTIQMSK